jgi:hypothetical protein
MKHLKVYESFQGESEISKICEMYDIENYTINKDGLIDVYGDVHLHNKELTKLPLKFGDVTGNFNCRINQLISLEGAPKSVGGGFYCDSNKLTSLEFGPKSVGSDFNCNGNQLTSLEFFPKWVGGNFYCYSNPIYNVWRLIIPHNTWDSQIVELFNDYDFIRGNDIIIDRLNEFLREIGKDPVDKVDGYNNI